MRKQKSERNMGLELDHALEIYDHMVKVRQRPLLVTLFDYF